MATQYHRGREGLANFKKNFNFNFKTQIYWK